MPADFSEYVNLTVFDKEPGDIYLDSVELARLVLPEFSLRIGSPEDAIFQAAAYMSALNISAINRLPDRLMAGIMTMLGFQRQEAISAEVDVTITLSSYEGGVLPIGTTFTYEAVFEDELQSFAFVTTSVLQFPATDLEVSFDYPSLSTTLVALQGGVMPPVGSGEELNVISAGTGIQSCVTNSPISNFANGVNADLDQEYLSKSVTYLRSLSSAITKASQVDAYLLSSYPSLISRVKTFDLTSSSDVSANREIGIVKTFLADGVATVETDGEHLFLVGDNVRITTNSTSVSATFDGTHEVTVVENTRFRFAKAASNSASTTVSGSVSAGFDVPGYVSVFAYGINSELTEVEKIQIADDLRDRTTAGLSIEVVDPTIVNFTITAEIAISQNYDSVDLQSTIEDAVVDFFSTNTFPYSYDRIRANQIVSLISQVPGAVYVKSLSISPVGEGWLEQQDLDLVFRYKGTLPSISTDDLSFTYTVVDLI
jgi:hypothetical protein